MEFQTLAVRKKKSKREKSPLLGYFKREEFRLFSKLYVHLNHGKRRVMSSFIKSHDMTPNKLKIWFPTKNKNPNQPKTR